VADNNTESAMEPTFSSAAATNLEDFRKFKPLYTLQPVKATREKQLEIWCNIVIKHCRDNNITSIMPSSFPVFSNVEIGRKLSPEGISAVVEHLITLGLAEWEDSACHSLHILLRSPDALASEIYKWAVDNDFIGTVLTLYELHSGGELESG
jgi:ESCRT-II complex subunit VPS25